MGVFRHADTQTESAVRLRQSPFIMTRRAAGHNGGFSSGTQSDKHNLGCRVIGEHKHQHTRDEAVNREGSESMLAYPGHEPGDGTVSDHERDHEPDGKKP